MIYRNMILELLFLYIFQSRLVMGFEVIYRISSPNCGNNVLRNLIDLSLYGVNMENKSSFIFSLKSAHDICIIATDSRNTQNYEHLYELYIGGAGNSWSKLKEVSNGVETSSNKVFGSFANNTYYVPFWFSWKNGQIQAGHGETLGINTFIVWYDPTPNFVRGIGIATCFGSTGDWKIKVKVHVMFGGYFSNCGQSNTKSESFVMDTFTASLVSCAVSCAIVDTCFGFNYHASSYRCELLSSGNEPLTDIMRTSIEGWIFFAKCYEGKGVCVGCFF